MCAPLVAWWKSSNILFFILWPQRRAANEWTRRNSHTCVCNGRFQVNAGGKKTAKKRNSSMLTSSLALMDFYFFSVAFSCCWPKSARYGQESAHSFGRTWIFSGGMSRFFRGCPVLFVVDVTVINFFFPSSPPCTVRLAAEMNEQRSRHLTSIGSQTF